MRHSLACLLCSRLARVERIVSDREPVLAVSCVPATLTATATATATQLQLQLQLEQGVAHHWSQLPAVPCPGRGLGNRWLLLCPGTNRGRLYTFRGKTYLFLLLVYLCRIQNHEYICLRDLAHVLVLPLDGGAHRLCLGAHSVQDPVLLRQLRVEATAQVAQPGPDMSAMIDNVCKPTQYSSFLALR